MKRRDMSDNAIIVMKCEAVELRIRLRFITTMLRRLPNVPNMNKKRRLFSPKSQGRFIVSFWLIWRKFEFFSSEQVVFRHMIVSIFSNGVAEFDGNNEISIYVKYRILWLLYSIELNRHYIYFFSIFVKLFMLNMLLNLILKAFYFKSENFEI